MAGTATEVLATYGVVHTTLENGLEVLLKPLHTAPVISHWIWYRVGSRDEPTGRTGISHWVEHMLFKGTPQFPAGVLDRAISRTGGYWNAFTYMDWTTYFETLPAEHIDLALRLEADRMVNALFDPKEVEAERTVILSERQGYENEPLFLLGEEVQAAAFRVHPYHHEIIGDVADLQRMTRDDLYQHYRTYYRPNNAVLAVAGAFDPQDMLERIRRYFGDLEPGPEPPRLERPEPPQRGERRVEVRGPGETTFLQLAYKAPRGADPDFFPLVVLASLLTGPVNLNLFGSGITNHTARLYQALVETRLAVAVGGSLSATIDPYLYVITVTVPNESDPDQVLERIDREIQRLQDEGPQPHELERAQKQARALFAYGSESITNQAYWLGYSTMFADYAWFATFVERLAQVSAQEVQRVAREVLQPHRRVVGLYLPTGGNHG